MTNTLILGVGNPILTDDGVGLKIAQKIKEGNPELEVVETTEAGITLLDVIVGYDKLIVIDSIKTEQGKPGQVYKLELADLKPAKDFSSSHGVDLVTALELGRRLGYRMPKNISLYGVEIGDNTTFGEKCTEEVEKRIPFITKQIIDKEKLWKNFEPKIVLFYCNWCSPAGADRALASRLKGNFHPRMVKITCTGRIEPSFIFDAFARGADGVLVAGCPPGDCHYVSGNYKAMRRLMLLKNVLPQFGIESDRLRGEWISTCEAPKFLSSLNEFVSEVTKLGPLTAN